MPCNQLITDDASEDVDEEDEESEDQENGSLIGIAKSNLRARPKNAQKEKARLKADLLRRVSRIVSKKKKGDKVMNYFVISYKSIMVSAKKHRYLVILCSTASFLALISLN